MAAFSLHGFSFFRHLRRRSTLICFYVSIIYFSGAKCASITNSSEKQSAEDLQSVKNGTNILARRQLLPGEQILALNPYIPGLQLGYPAYQNVHSLNQGIPYSQLTSSTVSNAPSTQSQKKRLKVKTSQQEELKQASDKETGKVKTNASSKTKDKKEKRKKEKLQAEAIEQEKVESKTVVGDEKETGRGCPACEGGPCDPFLDTKNNISGIPVIQILVALAVGAFWAAVFAFVLHNFIGYQKDEGGYGYGPSPTPEYGPVSEYGAPTQYGAPQSEYGAPTGYSSNQRISYGKGYGRRSQGYTFNDLSNWVWGAIDKFASKYDS